MAYDIGIGGGKTARVEEPERAMFPNNLSGAIQFTLFRTLYNILEFMGGSLGAFLAGLGVQFLGRIEPELVHYARPLIELVLEQEELPEQFRLFLEQLLEPTHEGAAAILGPMVGQVSGAAMGSLIGSLTAPTMYLINRLIRPTIPSVEDVIAMSRRGDLDPDFARTVLEMQGFKDAFIDSYLKITRPQAGVSDLVMGYYRGNITHDEWIAKMTGLGFTQDVMNLFLMNAKAFLDIGDMMRAWFRKEMTEEQIRDLLQRMSYSEEDITTLFRIARPIPSPADLVHMGVREAFRDDVAAMWKYDEDFPPDFGTYMELHGYSPEWAKFYWRAHWALPSLSMGYEMYHRGVITLEELQTLLRISDIPRFWREKLIEISHTPLTRVDVRRMYGLGVLDRSQVLRSYLDIGYSPTNAEYMTEFTVRYETAGGVDKLEEYKDLTRSVVIQAYRKRILSRSDAVTRLAELEYEQEDIEILLSLADWQKEIEETPDLLSDYQKDLKSIIEKAFSRRVLSKATASKFLIDVGFAESEAEYTLNAIDFWYGFEQLNTELKAVGDAYVARAYNRQDALQMLGRFNLPGQMQEGLLYEWDIERNTRSRRLTEAQYRKAYNGELINLEEYKENLRGLGYTEYDIWVLCAMMVGKDDAGPPTREGPLLPPDRR